MRQRRPEGCGQPANCFQRNISCLALQSCLTSPTGTSQSWRPRGKPCPCKHISDNFHGSAFQSSIPITLLRGEIKPDTMKDGWYFACQTAFCASFPIAQNKQGCKENSVATLGGGEGTKARRLCVFSLLVSRAVCLASRSLEADRLSHLFNT